MLRDEIVSIMRKNGLAFNKALGQNFLIDENVINNTIKGAEISSRDTVLEIGAGLGVLTRRLVNVAQKVVAIEFDRKLADYLTKNADGNLTVICGDVLKLDLLDIINTHDITKIVANLPYYITSPIIMRILEEKLPVKSATLMVQLEVAYRITASPANRDYGALTLACNYYSSPQILFTVPAQCFMPAPQVDSAIIRMDILESPPIDAPREDLFRLIKAAFSQRRKKAANSISAGLGIEKARVLRALEHIGKSENTRAEELSLEDFAQLLHAIENS